MAKSAKKPVAVKRDPPLKIKGGFLGVFKVVKKHKENKIKKNIE